MSIKILLVDDHEILLDGIKSILAKEVSLTVIGEVNTAYKALDFIKANPVDLMVTDFNLPEMNGLSLIRMVKKIQPDLKILMLSMHDEIHLVREIIKEEINGYVLKSESHAELLKAIESINQGGTYFSSGINAVLESSQRLQEETQLLSEREKEILKLLVQEIPNKSIGEKLYISERTVETHRKNIFKKTKNNTLAGLVLFAYKNGLI